MRILKIVQAYFPFQERGGPVLKVRALARGLAQRGHEITVLTADLGLVGGNRLGIKAERCQWGWRAEQDGVEAIYLSTLAHHRAFTINPRVVAFCRASLGQFDLVHFYGLYDLLGPAVGYFCRRQGIPYVIEPMGMHRPIVQNIRLKRMYYRFFGARFVDGARFLIATSEQERQDLNEDGIEVSRIVVRRNGIDVPEKLPTRGEFRRQWGIAEDKKLILFLGRLVLKKSPEVLLEAFIQWRGKDDGRRSAVLVMAGPEEDTGLVSRLKRVIDQQGLRESVIFPGPLYGDDKWRAYRDADVFVLPSQNENFGNTVAESAACGTPVIVTDRCGIAPLVGQAGLVVPYGRSEMERALAQMLGDTRLWRECREGCSKMTQGLSWKGPLDQTEALYRCCISEGTGK
jgi:glycosyltransferase involved in cell wall biosynthesis